MGATAHSLARQAIAYIQKKRMISEPLELVEVEASYTGKNQRLLDASDELMAGALSCACCAQAQPQPAVRRQWEATSAYFFAYRRKSSAPGVGARAFYWAADRHDSCQLRPARRA